MSNVLIGSLNGEIIVFDYVLFGTLFIDNTIFGNGFITQEGFIISRLVTYHAKNSQQI